MIGIPYNLNSLQVLSSTSCIGIVRECAHYLEINSLHSEEFKIILGGLNRLRHIVLELSYLILEGKPESLNSCEGLEGIKGDQS